MEPSGENEGLEQAGRRKAEKRSGHKNVQNLIEKRLFGGVLGAVPKNIFLQPPWAHLEPPRPILGKQSRIFRHNPFKHIVFDGFSGKN